jgi:DNA-binding transcriptional regulator YiaG
MTSPQTGALRGTTGAAQQEEGITYSMSTSLRTAAALVAVSAASMSCRSSRAKAVARKADPGEDMVLKIGDGSVKLAAMLYEMAMKKKEAVPVAQDMMRLRDANMALDKQSVDDAAIQEANQRARKTLQMSPEERAKIFGAAAARITPEGGYYSDFIPYTSDDFKASYGPFQSTVVEKFVEYLGKKGKLKLMEAVASHYVDALYARQDIKPVLVTSASAMSAEQKDAIIAKMKVLTKASDIKLKVTVNPALVGGFLIEWNFLEIDQMKYPSNSIDMTLQSMIGNQAVKEGVVAAV